MAFLGDSAQLDTGPTGIPTRSAKRSFQAQKRSGLKPRKIASSTATEVAWLPRAEARKSVNLTRDPEAGRTLLGVFDSVDAATETVSGIIAAGIVPAALEMLDMLMIQAVEQAFHFGFPTDAGAILIIEVDGLDAGLDRDARDIAAIVQAHGGSVSRSIAWRTRKEPEYVAIWKSRKSAFGAIGRLSPTFCTQDGVVPRTKLPHILRHITRVGERYDLRIANVFHAGDGNIHPILLFDERDSDQVKRVLAASREILDECIAQGGSVTGEHGIGVEKMEFMPRLFSPEDLAAMIALRNTFNSEGRCSPGKKLPDGGGVRRAQKAGASRVGLSVLRGWHHILRSVILIAGVLRPGLVGSSGVSQVRGERDRGQASQILALAAAPWPLPARRGQGPRPEPGAATAHALPARHDPRRGRGPGEEGGDRDDPGVLHRPAPVRHRGRAGPRAGRRGRGPAGAFDAWTVDTIRAVQKAVDRVLSGEDIRYYPTDFRPEDPL